MLFIRNVGPINYSTLPFSFSYCRFFMYARYMSIFFSFLVLQTLEIDETTMLFVRNVGPIGCSNVLFSG